MEKINLDTFAGGALQEKFDDAIGKILKNMQDPNTPWKVKRAITIEIGFSQNEDRDDAQVDVSVKTKVAPTSPVGTRIAIGTDLKTGEIFAEEYGKQIRGQMSINDIEEGKNVVDFKKAIQA